MARYEILCYGKDYEDTDYCQCNTNQIDPEFYTLFPEAAPSNDKDAVGVSSLMFGDDFFDDTFDKSIVYLIYAGILLLGLALLTVFAACCYVMNRDKRHSNEVLDGEN